MNFVDWYCPKCGEFNSDYTGIKTHCSCCGEIVFVSSEYDVFDTGHKIEDGYYNLYGEE